MAVANLENFMVIFLKGNGDLKDRSIQRWHLATDLYASGVFEYGYFDHIKIDGPTTSGYVLTTDADGWGTWQESTGGDLSDIYVPYVGATKDVNLGTNSLTVSAGEKIIFDGA